MSIVMTWQLTTDLSPSYWWWATIAGGWSAISCELPPRPDSEKDEDQYSVLVMMMSKNLKGCSEGKMCLGVQRLECWYLCISGGAVYNSDFTPVGEWYLPMHGWFHGLVLCKVLEWLSVRFRQEMSVVKCHLLLSSEPQKLPHSTTQKQENFPFFKNILSPKKGKR